jgi:phosphohistidine phosphatase
MASSGERAVPSAERIAPRTEQTLSSMHLILWRHADAEDGIPDSSRALTDKGRKQAKTMAKWLTARLPEDAVVLVSPATRARQTAEALRRAFETVAALDVGASPRAVLGAVGWPGRGGTVLVVGHQPTLGQVAARLLAGTDSEWAVKKAAIWWFEARTRGGRDEAMLRAVVSPDLI